jgi:hypothetical protein
MAAQCRFFSPRQAKKSVIPGREPASEPGIQMHGIVVLDSGSCVLRTQPGMTDWHIRRVGTLGRADVLVLSSPVAIVAGSSRGMVLK